MEQGAAKLAKILAFALLLGIAVTAFNPAYRQAFLAIARGTPKNPRSGSRISNTIPTSSCPASRPRPPRARPTARPNPKPSNPRHPP